EAQKQTRVARAQALAANAVAQLDNDPERSLLLAMDAISTTRRLGELVVPQAEDALHYALWRCLVRATLRGHAYLLTNAAFSPDGRMVVTANDDGTAKLWDVATGQARATLSGHTAGVQSAAFSPDGRLVVTASADGTVKLWDVATGQPRATLSRHTQV